MESTIADLVRRAVDGEDVAWAAIVDRFAPLLWSICRRHRLSGPDADDVAQAVWLRLLEHLPGLREPAALPGWLSTTTRRECLRVVRAERASQPAQELHEETVPDQRTAAVDDDLLRAERFDALRAAFGLLGERCRRLLALLLQDPPPEYAQIGAALGMPVGSIGPTRGRCLDSLRRAPELAALLAAGPGLAGS